MVEFVKALNDITWPGALAMLAICGAIVGCAFAYAWMIRD